MKIAVVGFGRMGQKVKKVVEESETNEVAVILDPDKGYPWKDDSLKGVDCAICFTTPEAGYKTTWRILRAGVNAVVATTDFYLGEDSRENEDMIKEFEDLAWDNQCRMIYSPNFALGVRAFFRIVASAARELFSLDYDPAIMEWHHSGKADVSGTAKKLGNLLISESRKQKSALLVGDCAQKRQDSEITIGSARAGKIPGTHQVIFDSEVDTIELIHRVRDPNIFAQGALDAAHIIKDFKPGIYTVDDMLACF